MCLLHLTAWKTLFVTDFVILLSALSNLFLVGHGDISVKVSLFFLIFVGFHHHVFPSYPSGQFINTPHAFGGGGGNVVSINNVIGFSYSIHKTFVLRTRANFSTS